MHGYREGKILMKQDQHHSEAPKPIPVAVLGGWCPSRTRQQYPDVQKRKVLCLYCNHLMMTVRVAEAVAGMAGWTEVVHEGTGWDSIVVKKVSCHGHCHSPN